MHRHDRADVAAVEPKKRFKWTPELREVFYTILMADSERLDLEGEKLCVASREIRLIVQRVRKEARGAAQ